MVRRWIWIPLYVALAVLVVLSYITTREYLISTPIGYIVVSNLTLNYVLFTFLLGGVAGWMSWTKLFAKKTAMVRMVLTLVTTFLVAMAWLVIAQIGGYQVRGI